MKTVAIAAATLVGSMLAVPAVAVGKAGFGIGAARGDGIAYVGGAPVVTMAKGGLMYEASVGGQKFEYEAYD